MLKSRAAQDSCKEIPFLMQTPLLMQKKIHAVAMVLVLARIESQPIAKQ